MKTKVGFCMALAGLTTLASAYNFSGSDWLFSYTSQVDIHLNSAFGGNTVTVNPGASNDPISVTQSVTNAFLFNYSVAGIDGFGDFDVSHGSVDPIVTDNNAARLTGPMPVGPLTLRFDVPAFIVTGSVTGISSAHVGPFGERAYLVTGDTADITGVGVQALVATNTWVPAGTAEVHLTNWSMIRPVPEPASLITLSLGAIALLKRRKLAG